MNQSLPNVAVLLTSYNGEDFIEEQCVSILSQIGVNVTIFFSDDCSSDSTLAKIKDFCSLNNNCYILSESLRFGSACENFLNLILKAPIKDFDYISLSDQDDIWLPLKLKNAIHQIIQTKSSGYSSDIISWNPDTSELKRIVKHGAQTRFDYMFQGPGPGCTFVMKAASVIDLSKFLSSMTDSNRKKIWFHDWFIYSYFRANNKKWFIDSYSGMLYRQHASNVIGSNIGLKGILDRIKVLKKWRNQTIILSKLIGYSDTLPIYKFNKLGFYIIKTPFKSRRKLIHSIMLFLASIFRIF